MNLSWLGVERHLASSINGPLTMRPVVGGVVNRSGLLAALTGAFAFLCGVFVGRRKGSATSVGPGNPDGILANLRQAGATTGQSAGAVAAGAADAGSVQTQFSANSVFKFRGLFRSLWTDRFTSLGIQHPTRMPSSRRAGRRARG